MQYPAGVGGPGYPGGAPTYPPAGTGYPPVGGAGYPPAGPGYPPAGPGYPAAGGYPGQAAPYGAGKKNITPFHKWTIKLHFFVLLNKEIKI